LIRFAAMALPVSRYWFSQIIGWGIFTLVNIFFALTFDRLNGLFVKRLLLFLFFGICITHLMRWLSHRINLLYRPLNKQIPGFILLAFGGALVIAFLETVFYRSLKLTRAEEDAFPFAGSLLIAMFSAFIYLFIWVCIYFIYHYVQKSRRQQVDTLRLEALVKELELKTIKAHINPHFIFNALNSIRALIDENPERARSAITELSNILRSSMQADKDETVSLEKELSIVKDYLALETIRFEDRLKVIYKIDEDTLDLRLPPMMLQTLVENAIKHGVSRQMEGGVIRVISDFTEGFHELRVQNTGQLSATRNAEGFGLSSTQNRLSLLYGPQASFEINQVEPELVEAKLQIPVAEKL